VDPGGQRGRARGEADLKRRPAPQNGSSAGGEATAPVTPKVVTDDHELRRLAASLGEAPRYALDTEFHRERTYYPRLALLQLAWDDQLVLVDPLAVDLRPLAEVFEGPGVAVIHAASQDLEVLDVACGGAPATVFDTQVAAGFLGYSGPSLGNLLERELDVHLAKADRLTDWLHRPLGADQLRYAADDVAHLLTLDEHLRKQLRVRGRLDWAAAECGVQRARVRGLRAPEDAWLRLKDSRSLNGRARAVARSLAAWRERRAAQLDQPVRHVLSDLAILSIAQHPPADVGELARIRGVGAGVANGRLGSQILEAVAEGRQAPVPPRPETRNGLDPSLRPVVTLVSAWVSQLARDLDLDPALVATRHDIEELLAGSETTRLRHGWRAELLAEPVEALRGGRAALAFDRDGTLTLEVRSGEEFVLENPRAATYQPTASTTADSPASVSPNG
jgi:ribonuclease D